MPQLNLITGDGVPEGLTIGFVAAPTDPTKCIVSVQVLNKRMQPIAKYGVTLSELEALCLPWLAKGVVEAYQYAPDVQAIIEVAKHMVEIARTDARKARRRGA